MSPSRITLDLSSDFDDSTAASQTNGQGLGAGGLRTLLLAPPSVSAHEEKLRGAFATFDRAATDLQMLDRLSAGLVALPASTYDLILVLTDADGSRRAEAVSLLATRDVLGRLASALRPGGKLRSEDNYLGSAAAGTPEAREAILAGLVAGGDGFVKPEEEEVAAVPLRFGANKKKNGVVSSNGANGTAAVPPASSGARSSAGPAVDSVTINVAGKPQTLDMAPPAAKIAGVGFVDFSDDFGDYEEDDDDELIDEDTLLGDEDLKRPIQQPAECKPKPGQKRKACKDCTCGLAERLEAKDKARREKADQGLSALKLASEDLNELDFTVKGKTGSCNSCSLGDAFRCADCPYIGLPPFKPGEEVTILNNVAQF